MCDAASERRVERVCCPPVIFLPARNLVARGWGKPTDQASRPRGLGQGHPPPRASGDRPQTGGTPTQGHCTCVDGARQQVAQLVEIKKSKEKVLFCLKKIHLCRKLKQIQCDLNDPFVSYIYLSASPTHLLLEVGWLTKLLYIVKFDFGSFQRLQFL